MTCYAITGASGPFSQGVVRHLLAQGIPASDLILLSRNPDKLALAVPDHSVDAIPWSSDDIVSMEVGIRDGWFDIESRDVELLTGTPAQSFRDFALSRQVDLRALVAEGAGY